MTLNKDKFMAWSLQPGALESRESFLFIDIVHSKTHKKLEALVVQQKGKERCGNKLRL